MKNKRHGRGTILPDTRFFEPVNKVLNRIAHHFGYMMDTWDIEDISIQLPTGYSHSHLPNDWYLDDVKDQVLRIFKKDLKLKQRCTNSYCVWVSFYVND